MAKHKELHDIYRFPGLCPERRVSGIFGDPRVILIRLKRREKTACGECGPIYLTFYDRKTRRVRDLSCEDIWVYLDVEIRRLCCRRCV